MEHHKIKRMRVEGGFLDGFDIEFSDGLVCIIGGRGSGKTTILELLRFVLGKTPDKDGKPRRTTQRFQDLIEANLGKGVVEIEFETQDGLVYTLQRSLGDPAPIVLDTEGNSVDPSLLDTTILIDAAIFSQNEVEEIATRPEYLRDVIDRFCAQDLARVQHQIDQSRAALQRNASDLLQLRLKEQKSTNAGGELKGLEEKLKKLREDVAKAKLDVGLEQASKEKEVRTAETTAISRALPAIEEARSGLAPVQTDLIGECRQVFSDAAMKGANRDVFAELLEAFKAQVERFKNAIAEARAALDSMETATNEAQGRLTERHQEQDTVYQKLLKQHSDHQVLLREMHNVAKQVAQLQATMNEAEQLRKRIEATEKERETLLDKFSDLCAERFRVRNDVASRLTTKMDTRIRIRIEENADNESFLSFLQENRDTTNPRHYNKPLRKVVQAVPPHELSALVAMNDVAGLAHEAAIDEDFAASLIGALGRNPKTRLDLEVVNMDDVPILELQVGNQWRPSHQLSTGQMCGAVLPLLLAEAVAPLGIDQLEDNLDNQFISGVIVGQIVKTARTRQMILITHNPNIPVLGLANQVIAMECKDGLTAEATRRGTVDEMKDVILAMLEGGARAFQERKKRYGC